jgi:hypothetical protein
MARLSLMIPVDAADRRPTALIQSLATKPDLDIEILVVSASSSIEQDKDLAGLVAIDPRVRLFAPGTGLASSLALWNAALMETTGEWLSLVRPDDSFEPEAGRLADVIKSKVGTVDAIGWNALQISPTAEPGNSNSIAIPTGFDPTPFDKTSILKSFFLWEGSWNAPKVPFGLSHAIVARPLALNIAETIRTSGRDHDMAQWEWTARVSLIGESFVFCPRPLSVINVEPYRAPDLYAMRPDLPFNASQGLTGGIAEIQHSLFAEMGASWGGAQENFIRAITIDCMMEMDPERFNAKCNGYYAGLRQWEGGKHANLFKPQFTGPRPLDRRRGLHGSTLMVDRHIGGAKTAQDFYQVVRNFLVPIGLLCGGKAV